MISDIGTGLLRLARHAVRAIRETHDEQVYIWETFWRSTRAMPPTTTGPLRWVPSIKGYRLDGSFLPGSGQGCEN
jgi:hypothetical protein